MKGLYFCNTACPIDIFVFGGIFFDVSPNNVFRNPISPPWQSCLNLQGTQYPYLGTPYYRSEEHTSELQSLMRISYAVFCLKKKKKTINQTIDTNHTYNLNTNIHAHSKSY